jgi:hypothetical protein
MNKNELQVLIFEEVFELCVVFLLRSTLSDVLIATV